MGPEQWTFEEFATAYDSNFDNCEYTFGYEGPEMRLTATGWTRIKLHGVCSAAAGLENHAEKTCNTWIKNFDSLEHSLITMRDELLGSDNRDVSVTGQILLENAAERAAKLTKDLADFHKELHVYLSKLGKNVEKNLEQQAAPQFKVMCDLTNSTRRKQVGVGLIYDYAMCTGLNDVGLALLKDCDIYDIFDINDPVTLQRIIIDLREGDIGSSLEYLERTRPPEEQSLRRSLQNQMITDCIEDGLDSFDRTIKQLRMFKYPFMEDKDRAAKLIGALLLGKPSKSDSRYENLFDFTNREYIAQKMTSFFVPYDAPLKSLLRFGMRNSRKLTELSFLGYVGSYIYSPEMPIGTFTTVDHSAFACPILKEQCTETNPPLRLVCGHVVSRDAIARLTSNPRGGRSIPRHARHLRFKCPYCPREQYLENARSVMFQRWAQPDSDSDLSDEEIDVIDDTDTPYPFFS